jgi:hypothetical protein
LCLNVGEVKLCGVKHAQGSQVGTSKLTEQDIRAIRRSPEPQKILAERYSVGIAAIWCIRSRRSWKHIDDPNDVPVVPDTPEQWRPAPIAGYEHLYEVSDAGNVRRACRYLPRPTLKPHLRRGYSALELSKHSQSKVVRIHRLVALAFLGPEPAGHQVNHKDGNKQNNRLDNLEYVTPQQNHQHAAKTGLKARGERNNHAKLATADVLAIRASRWPAHVVAARYDVHKSTIDAIRQRRNWKHI